MQPIWMALSGALPAFIIDVACFNRANFPMELAIGGWGGHVCRVKIVPQLPSWNRIGLQTLPTCKTSVYGVAVKLKGGGSVRVLSISKLFAWLLTLMSSCSCPHAYAGCLLCTASDSCLAFIKMLSKFVQSTVQVVQ